MAHIFYYLRIWEVPENNERRVYLFLRFQVFGSFPKPDAQRAILQTLIWYALLALPVWEIPLKYSSDFIARRNHRVVWFPAQDFLEEIIALCPLKHVSEKYAAVSDRLITAAFWSCFCVLFNRSFKTNITKVQEEEKQCEEINFICY